MTELKPCPFCGCSPILILDTRWPRVLDHGVDAYHIECQTNRACPIWCADNKYYLSQQEAIEAWNTRVEGNT